MSTQTDNTDNIEIIEKATTEKLTDLIKDAHQFAIEKLDDISDLVIKEYFQTGSDWRFYDDLKEKTLFFTFTPDQETKDNWKKIGFKKLPHLLNFLKKKYDGLEKFDVIFFDQKKPEPYYYVRAPSGLMIIYINLERYLEYGSEINPEINKLKITKYANQIQAEYSKKVPLAFFEKKDPEELSIELKNSYYKVLEDIIEEFEQLPESQKDEISQFFASTKIGIATITKYTELNPDAPEKQLNLFLQVLDKLGEYDIELLLKKILKSKNGKQLINKILKLPLKDQKKIAGKMTEMVKMYYKYEKLENSLRNFKKKIKEHKESPKKNEKDIHAYLAKHYWLLGIEYFDKKIDSDIDPAGNRTNDTKIGNKRPDFIIKKLDSLDKCVVIELEEANDPIFKIDGTLSPKIFDGINQVVDYNVEQRLRGFNSKGIAVIGSLLGMNISTEKKNRLRLLGEHYHNIEILTYEDIIKKSETTLKFWKEEKQETD